MQSAIEISTRDSMLTALSGVVRRRREQLHLSQEQLALRSGLHRTYISDIERGARNLSIKNLHRLAESLEMRASQLIQCVEESNA